MARAAEFREFRFEHPHFRAQNELAMGKDARHPIVERSARDGGAARPGR